MDLSTLRNEIDRIDSQLVQLYEQRMEICSQVAVYKIENGNLVVKMPQEKAARLSTIEMKEKSVKDCKFDEEAWAKINGK